MNKNIDKMDSVLAGTYKCDFQENQETVDDLERECAERTAGLLNK